MKRFTERLSYDLSDMRRNTLYEGKFVTVFFFIVREHFLKWIVEPMALAERLTTTESVPLTAKTDHFSTKAITTNILEPSELAGILEFKTFR